jgi:hypothetical protein
MAVIEGRIHNNYIHTKRLDFTTPTGANTITHTTEDWINGYIDQVIIVPSATTPPSSGFSVTLTDQLGIDILKGGGSSCSATIATDVYPAYPLDSKLSLIVGSAGTNKSGYIELHWREGNAI